WLWPERRGGGSTGCGRRVGALPRATGAPLPRGWPVARRLPGGVRPFRGRRACGAGGGRRASPRPTRRPDAGCPEGAAAGRVTRVGGAGGAAGVRAGLLAVAVVLVLVLASTDYVRTTTSNASHCLRWPAGPVVFSQSAKGYAPLADAGFEAVTRAWETWEAQMRVCGNLTLSE